ncbi:CLUMA_CG012612, isoform A [Clunio marinus]|uniref:CLUMA_CG012612, isoform A n=1 Tax=Clunio marinus TaxID=568069 RepID=A0A1J1IGR7_9DIPT|nr:CLUMA_CG012612, isoform A [Clunio marinus]
MSKILFVTTFALIVIGIAPKVSGLKCYECNSFNNTDCLDPFVHSNAEGFYNECLPINKDIKSITNEVETVEARWCRKLTQNVYGKIRIIRSCGFINETEQSENVDKSCYKSAFTSHVSSIYCACAEDGCNYATHNIPVNFLFLITSLIVIRHFLEH